MSWDYGILEIAFGSQPDSATPLWANVTSRLDPAVDGVITRGRPSELDDIQTSALTCALNNADHYLTPGNPASPWYPNVKLARRIRYREIIDGIVYPLFDGYMQFPDIDAYAIADATHKYDQVINISAVDRIARLDRARSFYSTLAEHVRYNGGTDLKVYYLLNEAELRWKDIAGTREPLKAKSNVVGPVVADLLSPGGGATPPGDDIPGVDFSPQVDSGLVKRAAVLTSTWANPIQVSSSTVTIAFWMTWDATHSDAEYLIDFNADQSVLSPPIFVLQFTRAGGGGTTWFGNAIVYDGVTTYSALNVVLNNPPPADAATLVALRLTLPSGLFEMWVGDTAPQSTTISGTPPSAASANVLRLGNGYDGALGGVQVYVGSAYTRAVHLAQYAMGQTGLYRQRADQRIATLLGYAGVATTDQQLDTASALMTTATLAAQKPGAEIRVAAAADSGLLFTGGDGKITFHSRSRRYNPQVAAYVDLAWLTDPWKQRLQPPINVARVSRNAGVEAISRNDTSATEYGEYELPGGVVIESATDADPENLAKMYTLQYPDPRMRAPEMTVDLMAKSKTVLHTVLAREISDRISMTGLPGNAPEGIGEQHIEGIIHRFSTLRRSTSWNTSPVLGPLPGVAAVWPQVGTAVVDSSTLIAY